MRKQRRQAELQDKRDRIRMGLIPPDPPKGNANLILISSISDIPPMEPQFASLI
jgi:hypothetical protein